ncbi:hypothetical protein FHP29_16380 [Nocardioides albidus]|uniref:Uncharacterized protein n=1 Tax=Nocardioides albidus TaxID=1517589 RepID=A0A5C4VNF2_9ACTN|nr:hypothetical protein FHP29_16380 [Nocardioides albidus]
MAELRVIAEPLGVEVGNHALGLARIAVADDDLAELVIAVELVEVGEHVIEEVVTHRVTAITQATLRSRKLVRAETHTIRIGSIRRPPRWSPSRGGQVRVAGEHHSQACLDPPRARRG